MLLSPHILTLVGALVALAGATLLPWGTLPTASDVAVPGVAVWPTGQVVAGLASVLVGLIVARLWGRRASLDGGIGLTSVALLVWLAVGAALSALVPSEFTVAQGVWVSTFGAAVATFGALRAHWVARLTVVAEVSVHGRPIARKVMRQATLWRALDVEGDEHPAPVFRVADDGTVAMGVARAHADSLRLRGHAVDKDRWIGDPQASVQVVRLSGGDWGVLAVGNTDTRFQVTGEVLRGPTDRWAAAAIAVVALTQIGLLGLSTGQPQWRPTSARSAMPAKALLDERPPFDGPVAPPVGVASGFTQPSSALPTDASGQTRAGSPQNRRAASAPGNAARGDATATGTANTLSDLLVGAEQDSALREVLSVESLQAHRFDTIFNSPGVAPDPSAPVLAYRGQSSEALDAPGAAQLLVRDPSAPSELSTPKQTRRAPANTPKTSITAMSGGTRCSEIHRAMRRRSAGFQACLMARQRLGVVSPGRVALRFMVTGGDDSIASVSVLSNSTGDPELARCLVRRARQLRLTSPAPCSDAFTFHVGARQVQK